LAIKSRQGKSVNKELNTKNDAGVASTRNATTRPASLWMALAASAVLSAGFVAGCNQSSTGNSTGGTTTTSTTDSSFSSDDSVATVNGEAITRGDLYKVLVTREGEPQLAELIRFETVMQELKKNNLEVTDEELNAVIEDQKLKNPASAAQIDELLKTGGTRLDVVKSNLRYRLAIDKLITKDVKADPAQVQAWFNKNQKRYATPSQVTVGLLLASTKVRADTMLTQLKGKSKTFAQLVEEQKKAKDPLGARSVDASPPVPSDTIVETMGPILGPIAQKLGVGQFSSVQEVSKAPNPAYAIMTIVSKTGGGKPDFKKLKSQVETEYKLEQVARESLKNSPTKQTLEQAVAQTEGMIMQQNMQQQNFSKPGYRDVLSALTQQKGQELVSRLQTSAKVEVSDPSLKRVEEQFKPIPTPGATPSAAAPGTTTPGAPAAPAPTQ
jgi:hypothetical protein